jgi:membrane protease YdiL (CAAX protease family)
LERSLVAPLTAKLAAITPAHFDWTWTNIDYFRQFPRGILLLMSVVYIILNVFVGPIVEELYFRGYLTSKLSRFGVGAPIIVTVLFSLYHLWLPFQNLFRIAVFFPAAYFAWKEKNIFISMVFHCVSNLFSTISFLIALYAV